MIKANSLRTALFTGAALTLLAGCADTFENFDLDMRDLGGNTLDTTNAARNLPPRPEPDNRGVISYPNYQVVVAIRGDTVTTVAQRLDINAAELARANALSVDTALNQGAVLLLPNRVA
ncbi:MAG: LysM domain-containing protein, partial [Marivivens sp.]|nr:LysM domain-containing protein [Marivivens sp.]